MGKILLTEENGKTLTNNESVATSENRELDLFNFIKVVKILITKKPDIAQIKKIKLVPILMEKNTLRERTKINEIIAWNLERFSLFANFNYEKIENDCLNPKNMIDVNCISAEMKKWKSKNTNKLNGLKEINNLYNKMEINPKEDIKWDKNKKEIEISGKILENKYNEWKKNKTEEKEWILQGLFLDIVNFFYKQELNEKLKEMKNKGFFKIIEEKLNNLKNFLLLETESEQIKQKIRKKIAKLEMVSTLKELNKKETDIEKLTEKQFIGFFKIMDWTKQDLIKEYSLETEQAKGKDKSSDKNKWYIISLSIGGGIIFLLIVNYLFWKLKK